MRYTFEYTNDEERENIIKANKSKYLIEERNISNGNFLVFTSVKPLEVEVGELKQEKSTLQLALAETIEKQEIDKVNNQLALADLLETLIKREVL